MSLLFDKSIYNALRELAIIDARLLEQTWQSSEALGISFYDAVLNSGLFAEQDLVRLVAEVANVKPIDLSRISIDKKTLFLLPEAAARHYQIVLFKVDELGVHVAGVHPESGVVRDFLGKKFSQPVLMYAASKSQVQDALVGYSPDMSSVVQELLDDSVATATKVTGASQEPSITEIVDTLLKFALRAKASDIHIEPHEKKTLIRFRVDGVLRDVTTIPKVLHEQIVSRIKVISDLRTDEHLAPQDGKLRFTDDEETIDVRVSIVPVTEGEKIVMRLLSERSRRMSLHDLGMEGSALDRVTAAYQDPHGMILATGPTGSGKTTTLYAVLKMINKRQVNIATIEDPVEYRIEGVNHIQVNSRANLTFASGLRSIVRQDPDIILVGEIRDEETADIAVNAALTGHLVLSTLHTNDAVTTIPRLIDMGVEPFLIASSVNVIVAQRLVRSICKECKTSIDVATLLSEKKDVLESELLSFERHMLEDLPQAVKTKIFGEGDAFAKARLYYGKGCSVCSDTGFSGRIGIFEVLTVTAKIREAVTSRRQADEIKRIAIDEGMIPLIEDGLQKVRGGETTLSEVLRVTKE